MTAVEAERLAEAPFVAGMTVNVMMPPATASPAFLAVTITASGFAKAAPTAPTWSVLPVTGVRVKPWLWKAPMSGGESSGSPRWSALTPFVAEPAPIARLPGSKAMVCVGPP